MTQLDLAYTRAQFPAFAEPTLAGQAFFENAGGSYPCRQVVDRLTRFYRQRKVQPYAPFAVSERAGAEMDEARARLAALMGVDGDEVSFGPSTSANTYVLAQAFRGWLQAGDAIIVTNQDHEANSGVWRRLAADGIKVLEWKIDPETGHLPLETLPALLDQGPKLVCFPHCSNVVAEINPVAQIVALAHAAGAVTCVDGVSYAPHGLPDVAALGADIYLFSAYKTYGPHQGIMVIRRELGMKLPNQGHSFNGESLYKRFTPAGPDHAQIAACAGIADYIDDSYRHHFTADISPVARGQAMHDLMRSAEIARTQPLLDYLAARNDLRLIGPRAAKDRAPTVAVVLDRAAEPVARSLAAHGVNCGGGDFYAVRPLTALGVDLEQGVLRMSLVHYTSGQEVDRLIRALDQVLAAE